MIIVIKGANKKLMQKEIRSKIFIKKREKGKIIPKSSDKSLKFILEKIIMYYSYDLLFIKKLAD